MLYFLYLRDQQKYNVNNGKGSTWTRKIKKLITESNLDIASNKYSAKNVIFDQLLSHNRLRIILREKMQTSFIIVKVEDYRNK